MSTAPLRFDCVVSRSLANTTIALSVFLSLTVVGMAALFLWIGHRTNWPSSFLKISIVTLAFTTLGVGASILFSYLYAPSYYSLTDRALNIERALSPITIPFDEIRSVRRLVPEDLRGAMRTFGADGLFARIGQFHSPALGNFRMYAKNTDEGVVVDARERFVLSPHPADEFIYALRARGGGPISTQSR